MLKILNLFAFSIAPAQYEKIDHHRIIHKKAISTGVHVFEMHEKNRVKQFDKTIFQSYHFFLVSIQSSRAFFSRSYNETWERANSRHIVAMPASHTVYNLHAYIERALNRERVREARKLRMVKKCVRLLNVLEFHPFYIFILQLPVSLISTTITIYNILVEKGAIVEVEQKYYDKAKQQKYSRKKEFLCVICWALHGREGKKTIFFYYYCWHFIWLLCAGWLNRDYEIESKQRWEHGEEGEKCC